jgi:hypothetical protein
MTRRKQSAANKKDVKQFGLVNQDSLAVMVDSQIMQYHLLCAGIPGIERRIPGWVCESCKHSGERGKGNKRRREV